MDSSRRNWPNVFSGTNSNEKTWRFIHTPLVSQCNELKLRSCIVSTCSDSAAIATLTRLASDPVAYQVSRKVEEKWGTSHSCYHVATQRKITRKKKRTGLAWSSRLPIYATYPINAECAVVIILIVIIISSTVVTIQIMNTFLSDHYKIKKPLYLKSENKSHGLGGYAPKRDNVLRISSNLNYA